MVEIRNTFSIISDDGTCLKSALIKSAILSMSERIEKRSIVFCLCTNSVGSLVGYLSFLSNGAVPLMLDAAKDKESLQNLLDIYRPNYIWAQTNHQLIGDASPVYSAYGYGLYTYSEEKVVLNDDLALLLTTSGSTGSPKLVRLSYLNIRSNAESIAGYLNIDEHERPITSLPMHYSYGLSVINSHLIKGATILLTDKAVIQKDFWAFAREQKATSIAGVPFTYEMLRRLKIFKMDLPFLKTMTQAGGKLNAAIAKEYIDNARVAGKKFIVMYGQTEATARMSYLPWEAAAKKYGGIGIAIPGGKFSLIDGEGREIKDPCKDGELIYCGANVSMGYADCRDDLSKGDENHGILHTGDMARRDADGFYYITGRLKRFVKIYGNRVNLDAAEQLLKSVATDCACVGVDDKLTVFTTCGDKAEELKALLVKKTGINVRAFSVQVVSSIPKNSSGKVLYAQLTNMLCE
jgi:acyl-CoA synthetase (AMP-forming)/AMP-acid ligase II